MNANHKEHEVGNDISIAIGGAVAHSAVYSEMIHAKIVAVTEKAVKVQNENGWAWFPKKALQPKGTDWYRLAKWFKPQSWFYLDKMATVSGQSAA